MHCALMLPRWQNRSDMKLDWYVLTIVDPVAWWHRVMAFNAVIEDRRSALLYNRIFREVIGWKYPTNLFHFLFKTVRSLEDRTSFLVPLKSNNFWSLYYYSGYHIIVSTKKTVPIRVASWEIFDCTGEAVGPPSSSYPTSQEPLPESLEGCKILKSYGESRYPVRMSSPCWLKQLPFIFLRMPSNREEWDGQAA